MTRTKVFTHALLAGIAILNLSVGTRATAEPITVTRGPGGAASIVDSNHIPLDARLQPMGPAVQFPRLVTRGPGGAAHIASSKGQDMALSTMKADESTN